jgi:hypothetical protein
VQHAKLYNKFILAILDRKVLRQANNPSNYLIIINNEI